MAGVDVLVGTESDASAGLLVRPLPPYSPIACDLLAALSTELRNDREAAKHPDVIAFAFWCRKGNLERLKAEFLGDGGRRGARLGLGLVFHITPSNVPVNFAFSFAFGLLAGNANRVRVPSKPFAQVDIICSALSRVLADARFAPLARMTSFVRYEQDDAITGGYSATCNARIIWGGDVAIQNIRRLPIPERSVEIAFADRYSFCVLGAPAINALAPDALAKLAQAFYNDTYLMDQNACSSPHLLVWQGEGKRVAKQRLFTALAELVTRTYDLQTVTAVDKYAQLCEDAIGLPDVVDVARYGNQLTCVTLARLPAATHELRGKAGYFYQLDADTLDDVAPVVNTRYQTLTYFGVDKSMLLAFVVDFSLMGIDRIVPVGAALDIGVVWDGYDVISTLSRVIDVQ
jgi:hypothetical protein